MLLFFFFYFVVFFFVFFVFDCFFLFFLYLIYFYFCHICFALLPVSSDMWTNSALRERKIYVCNCRLPLKNNYIIDWIWNICLATYQQQPLITNYCLLGAGACYLRAKKNRNTLQSRGILVCSLSRELCI